MFKTITLTLCVLGLGLLAAGCADVDLNVHRDPDRASQQAVANAGTDPRSAAEIQAENVQLRQTLVKLEQDHQKWDAALDRKDKDIDALKDQRDRLEDERDKAKDRAKGKD